MDPRLIREVQWLKEHPDFEEMPATIEEFLGPDYLNFDTARPGLIEALKEIFGEEVNDVRMSNYERAMFTGAIGIGKTTFASIAIPYMVHWVLCLKDPQKFYGLASGSRIAFMQMSTSAKQALEVIFGDLKARVNNSPWFSENHPYDPNYTKMMKFDKDIWVLPGSSEETAFEGYNILGGILDEMDSHKITERQDSAEVGYNTIHSRIASRFPTFDADDVENLGHRGLLICIGQMKKGNGFAAKKYEQFKKDPKAYTKRQSIWESYGWQRYTRKDGTRASFYYNSKSKKIISALVAGVLNDPNLIEIPLAYKVDFENDPEKALKDLAGIPPVVGGAFISRIDRIEECSERWKESHGGSPSPVGPEYGSVEFEPWFNANGDPRKRVAHIDFAKGGEKGDALGIAVGHISRLIEVRGDIKPYITIDCLIRMKARPGSYIDYDDVREIFYTLRDDLGFRIKHVSMDGFQSTDTFNILRKRRFETEFLSADKETLPYEDLRDAIYQRRIEWPPYMVKMRPNDTQLVDIALSECSQLIDTGKKIDHPPDGSKDVADGLACVTTTLMGDRTYRKGLPQPSDSDVESSFSQFDSDAEDSLGFGGIPLPSGRDGFSAPIPPRMDNPMGLMIPDRLRGR